jgi:hypothetical protein
MMGDAIVCSRTKATWVVWKFSAMAVVDGGLPEKKKLSPTTHRRPFKIVSIYMLAK